MVLADLDMISFRSWFMVTLKLLRMVYGHLANWNPHCMYRMLAFNRSGASAFCLKKLNNKTIKRYMTNFRQGVADSRKSLLLIAIADGGCHILPNQMKLVGMALGCHGIESFGAQQ